MKFRRDAQLDTSQVSDRRGMGFMGAAGGGVVGLIVLLITVFAGGGDTSGLSLGTGQENDLSAECETGADANQRDDCRIVAVVNSVQEYWTDNLQGYQEATTVFFTSGVNTGCGTATSAVGPFYCPRDQTIYIDLGFYDELRSQFGAKGGPFAEAYVIAHEYGHHVENLTGVLERGQDGSTGPTSSSVRIELMADCLAGPVGPGRGRHRLRRGAHRDRHRRRAERRRRHRRRPHPGEGHGPGRPAQVDPRLVRATPALVPRRLSRLQHVGLRHLRHRRPLTWRRPLRAALSACA